jgi:2-dehydropantoate 2-reductase
MREVMIEIAATRSGDRENVPSLLQDIRKGRRTEVDYLNGWVAATGATVGVATPTHTAIVPEVRSVELGHRPPAPENVATLAASVAGWYAPTL